MKYDINNLPLATSIANIDRFAVSLSLLCVVHCLLTPILLVAMPSLTSTVLGGEKLHLLLVFLILPTSLFSLTLGCKRHSRWIFWIAGLVGLALLIAGGFVEPLGLDHHWETRLTLIGSAFVASAHILNFIECRKRAEHGC